MEMPSSGDVTIPRSTFSRIRQPFFRHVQYSLSGAKERHALIPLSRVLSAYSLHTKYIVGFRVLGDD